MSDLERLLDLQVHDTEADQLRHRRATLPQRTTLTELSAKEKALEAEVAEPQVERDGLAREQKRIEDEVSMVEEKIALVDRQLYGEGITSPKEAQALQADLESLRRRQSSLEDNVLALMEEIEPIDFVLAETAHAVGALNDDRASVNQSLSEAEVAIDAELAVNISGRDVLLGSVPTAMLADYQRIRSVSGGIVVARLQGSTCQGCFLTLAAGEVDALRRLPENEIVNCPECGRLLVR